MSAASEYEGSPYHMGPCGGSYVTERTLMETLVKGRWAWVNVKRCTVCGDGALTAYEVRALERGESTPPKFPTTMVGIVLVAST